MKKLSAVMMLLLLMPFALAQTPAERIAAYTKEWSAFALEFSQYIDWAKDNGYKIEGQISTWNDIKALVQKAEEAVAAKKYEDAKTALTQANEKFATLAANIETIVREQDLEGFFEDLEKWIADVDAWLEELRKGGYDVTTVKAAWEKIRDQLRQAQDQFNAGNDETAWQTVDRASKEYARWESTLEKELNEQNKEWGEWCTAVGGWHDDLKAWVEGERAPAQTAKERGFHGAAEYLRMIQVELDALLETAEKALKEGDCGWAAENLEELESWREHLNEAGNEWYNNLLEQLAAWETWMSEKAKEIEELKATAAEKKGVEMDFTEIDERYGAIREKLDSVYSQLNDEAFVGWGADDYLAEADALWEELDQLIAQHAKEIAQAQTMTEEAMAENAQPAKGGEGA